VAGGARGHARVAGCATETGLTEMDFSRYAGQLRPLPYRDMTLLTELEQALIAALDRALLREKDTAPAGESHDDA
jgi:hypothetical protein